MVTIENKQSEIIVDCDRLQRHAEELLQILDYGDFDLGILLTTDQKIQEYNRMYRDKDKPTDVLSFPFYSDLQPGERIVAEDEDEKDLGDIIIAPMYVQEDAPKWGQSFNERMTVLLVHGICHLRGYDHETEEEYAVMHAEEMRLLGLLENKK